VVHGVMYILNKSMLRSLFWLAGFGCTVALFLV